MAWEKINNPKPSENSNEIKGKISRRGFLKGSLVAAGGYILGHQLLELLDSQLEETQTNENVSTEQNQQIEPTEEQTRINEENIASLAEVLDFDSSDDIQLDPETMEAIKNYWKKRYQENVELNHSLEQAYFNIGEWLPYLQAEFKKQGVPEKYVYLAIPESHWQIRAISRVGAVGPYQFTTKTAKAYGLKVIPSGNLDERMDPIKSATACAKLLKDLYNAGQDWDMALAGYNGGFFWQYLKAARNQKEDISYAGLLKFLESRINTIKREIKSQVEQKYIIQTGDSLWSIAQRFKIDIDELCRINNIEDQNQIKVGQGLTVSLGETKNDEQKNIWRRKIKGLEENLNYPPKFNAVYELIEKRQITEKAKPISFRYQIIEGGDIRTHIFRRSDISIYNLAKQFPGISANDILAANPQIDPTKLKGGEKLIIPDSQTGFSLQSLARKNNLDLKRLITLNPAIKNPDQPIPIGYSIRI